MMILHKILRALFGKWAVVLSHDEYDVLIKDYEYKSDFERTLSGMEHRLHSCDNADEILEETLRTAVSSIRQTGRDSWISARIRQCGLRTSGTIPMHMI